MTHTTAAEFDFSKKIAKYAAILKIGYQNARVYVGDNLSMGFSVGIRMVILGQLYVVTFAQTGSDTIGGLTLPMTLWLITMAQSQQLTSATRKTVLYLQSEIQSGNIAHVMAKPYSLVLYIYFTYLGRFYTRIWTGLICGFVVSYFIAGGITLTWPALLGSAILSFCGFTLNIIISQIIGLSAFWTEDVTGFRWIYDKLQWVFSGMIIPLAFFPDALRLFAEYSPFGVLFYPSARIFVGFEAELFFRYLSFQIGWIIVMGLILHVIYNKGKKNVSINGG